MKIYLAGQESFFNRGCEALVRSTCTMIRSKYQDAIIYVPSLNAERDGQSWKEHKDFGVVFVRAYNPFLAKIWKIFQSIKWLPFYKMGWPFPLPNYVLKPIKDCDYLLAIGGDNYSLDYFSIPSLLMAADLAALKYKKKVVLWGASLGPYSETDFRSKVMINHLSKFNSLLVRESLTYEYLKGKGFNNVHLVADSAFALEPQSVSPEVYTFSRKAKTVGFNMSPLVVRKRYANNQYCIEDEVSKLISWIADELGYNVLLVPHVIPFDNSLRNNDHSYLSKVYNRVKSNQNVKLLPGSYNAANYKYIISKCDYFIGARTHSTIAAFSSCVPTVSISYSTKSKGLNLDLFGDIELIVKSSDISFKTLKEKLLELIQKDLVVQEKLKNKIPKFKEKAISAVDFII